MTRLVNASFLFFYLIALHNLYVLYPETLYDILNPVTIDDKMEQITIHQVLCVHALSYNSIYVNRSGNHL